MAGENVLAAEIMEAVSRRPSAATWLVFGCEVTETSVRYFSNLRSMPLGPGLITALFRMKSLSVPKPLRSTKPWQALVRRSRHERSAGSGT
jgi:hypothetical protein